MTTILPLLLAAQAGTSTASPPASAAAAPVEERAEMLRADDFFAFSDHVDTRVTFAFSNVNVFAGPGERITKTSGYRIGVDPDFNLFLENVNTRFSGFETLSHLVLYKKVPSFFERWETEAAVAALVLARTDRAGERDAGLIRLFDSGSYVRLIRKLGDGDERKVGSVDVTAWPVSADRFRLGYTYLISWGGTAIFPGKATRKDITEGAVPGLRLRYRSAGGDIYAFAGFKVALLREREPGAMAGEEVPNYGGLGGFGFDIADMFIVEANGGVFQKGSQERPGLEGQPITAYGASARLTLYDGAAPPPSGDFRLYRNDPTNTDDFRYFKGAPKGTGYSVSIEGSALFQNLEDPDRFGSDEIVPALSAGIVGVAQLEHLKLRLDAFFQSANFILFNVPGFVPFQSISDASSTTPEYFVAATAEYFIEDWYLVPSLSIGLKVPATYRGVVPVAEGVQPGGARPGEVRTQIILNEFERTILPPEYADATPIIGAVFKLPLALSPTMGVAFEARFELNDNQVRIGQDDERGEVTYIFDDPKRLSLGLVFQSRW